MVIYEVYYRDYKKNNTNLIGVLTERRNDPRRRKNLIPSALKWARKEFGGLVADANAIYIIGKTIGQTSPIRNTISDRIPAFQGP